MDLILTVVLIVCMLLWLFSALPVVQLAPFNWAHPLLAWICVAILCFLVLGHGGVAVR
jgi:hypothetical protein